MRSKAKTPRKRPLKSEEVEIAAKQKRSEILASNFRRKVGHAVRNTARKQAARSQWSPSSKAR